MERTTTLMVLQSEKCNVPERRAKENKGQWCFTKSESKEMYVKGVFI